MYNLKNKPFQISNLWENITWPHSEFDYNDYRFQEGKIEYTNLHR